MIFKFIASYIILDMLGILTISTLGSTLIQHRIEKSTGEALYKEAISLASHYANTNYRDTDEIQETYHTLKTLAIYQDARILILNPKGVPLIDTDYAYTSNLQDPIDGFDPAALGTVHYQTGQFYQYIQDDVISTMVPITKNLHIKGYVSLHISMDEIIQKREGILITVYIIFLVLYLFSVMILGLFSFSVYRPLKKTTI